MNISITLPDGSIRQYDKAVSALQVAEDISPRLADASVCAELDGKLIDLSHIIESDASLVLHTFKSETGKEVYWHSTAHLMAQAVKQLFPDVLVTIGPAIEQGFYYDFDRDASFTDEELLQIEKCMQELSAQALPYTRTELSKAEALKLFGDMGESYKLELL